MISDGNGRRFTEREVAMVLRRAVDIDQDDAVETASSGLSLSELREIAGEVGIRSGSVDRAVAEMDRGRRVEPRTLLGPPAGHVTIRAIPGMLSPESLQDLVHVADEHVKHPRNRHRGARCCTLDRTGPLSHHPGLAHAGRGGDHDPCAGADRRPNPSCGQPRAGILGSHHGDGLRGQPRPSGRGGRGRSYGRRPRRGAGLLEHALGTKPHARRGTRRGAGAQGVGS